MKTVNQYDMVESGKCFTGSLVALRGQSFDKVCGNIPRNRVYSSVKLPRVLTSRE